MDGDLFKYFVEQTNARLIGIETALSDLKAFKAEMLASSRTTAMIVSGICGFLTMIATALLTYYTRKS